MDVAGQELKWLPVRAEVLRVEDEDVENIPLADMLGVDEEYIVREEVVG